MIECTCKPGDSKSDKNLIAPCPIHWQDDVLKIAQTVVHWSGKFHELGCTVRDTSVDRFTGKVVFIVELP